MDDIRQQDMRLFIKELISPARLIVVLIVFAILYTNFLANLPLVLGVVATTLIATIAVAHSESIKKRFMDRRFESLWSGCTDRLARFEEVLRKMRRDQVADLQEMPKTIREVSKSLYIALRRADIVMSEINESEKGLYNQPPIWEAQARDAQSKELYRVADKNIAEYRTHFAGVMGGVQRAEAQAAVFMTTLDTLRMKMLGYRLVGRSPEMPSHDFLEALVEAKAQLTAIDTALEELELGQYPRTIVVIPTPSQSSPPPIPPDVQVRRREEENPEQTQQGT
ncbi:MAG: hypothetical protein ACOYON_00820 [Fimbriimonas sp.]